MKGVPLVMGRGRCGNGKGACGNGAGVSVVMEGVPVVMGRGKRGNGRGACGNGADKHPHRQTHIMITINTTSSPFESI